MKLATMTLEGVDLDRAVALALGWRHDEEDESAWWKQNGEVRAITAMCDAATSVRIGWSPSTKWEHGGPIIESELIRLIEPERGGPWVAQIYRPQHRGGDGASGKGEGNAPLIAAMRAFVRIKFGDGVELPTT